MDTLVLLQSNPLWIDLFLLYDSCMIEKWNERPLPNEILTKLSDIKEKLENENGNSLL